MLVGVPKEIKERENRVSMTPAGVKQLVACGHKVCVEKGAGLGAGFLDEMYEAAGATLFTTARDVWDRAEMIVKVKEPVESEYSLLRPGLILYTYLHLAAEPELTKTLLNRKVTGIAYETVQLDDGSLPLLQPMSEVAGRMSIQVGAQYLEKDNGGKGLLLGGVPGVRRGQVTIIGAGAVGINAAKMAMGLGAHVTILDIDQKKLAALDDLYGSRLTVLASNPENIFREVTKADLVVGAVLVTGDRAPKLITEEMLRSMEKDSIVVDVAIDQGGSVENIKKTTHAHPIYKHCGVNLYAVTNMPGKVPMTSTYALTNVTFPYALKIANEGVERALESSLPLKKGLNTFEGKLHCSAVARALGL
jgi:alanine dehydrogenase